MRYMIAFVGAVLAAGFAAVFVSGWIASMFVADMRFESPDEVATAHALLFMGVNLVALVLGWLVGLAIGARFEKPEQRI